MGTYFIRIDTFWANSPDRFVGPFNSISEAIEEVDRSIAAENDVYLFGQSPLSIKDAIRIHGVMNKTDAKRMGMVDYQYGDESSNVIGTTIPDNISELRAIEMEND